MIGMRFLMAHRSLLVPLTIAALLGSSARAQQAATSSTAAVSAQDLAKSVHNPFEDFVKL